MKIIPGMASVCCLLKGVLFVEILFNLQKWHCYWLYRDSNGLAAVAPECTLYITQKHYTWWTEKMYVSFFLSNYNFFDYYVDELELCMPSNFRFTCTIWMFVPQSHLIHSTSSYKTLHGHADLHLIGLIPELLTKLCKLSSFLC